MNAMVDCAIAGRICTAYLLIPDSQQHRFLPILDMGFIYCCRTVGLTALVTLNFRFSWENFISKRSKLNQTSEIALKEMIIMSHLRLYSNRGGRCRFRDRYRLLLGNRSRGSLLNRGYWGCRGRRFFFLVHLGRCNVRCF